MVNWVTVPVDSISDSWLLVIEIGNLSSSVESLGSAMLDLMKVVVDCWRLFDLLAMESCSSAVMLSLYC